MTIEIDETMLGEVSGGDPCYYIPSHHDKQKALAAVVKFEVREFGVSADEVSFCLEDVHHVWTKEVGPKNGYDSWIEWKREATEGYEPATVVYP